MWAQHAFLSWNFVLISDSWGNQCIIQKHNFILTIPYERILFSVHKPPLFRQWKWGPPVFTSKTEQNKNTHGFGLMYSSRLVLILLCQLIRPCDTLVCCWDVKQPTNNCQLIFLSACFLPAVRITDRAWVQNRPVGSVLGWRSCVMQYCGLRIAQLVVCWAGYLVWCSIVGSESPSW